MKNINVNYILAAVAAIGLLYYRKAIFSFFSTRPKWLKIAESQIGVAEAQGAANNPTIISYHATTGGFSQDSIHWCSSFVNWCIEKAGLQGTGKATALSWQSWGKELEKPALGCIAVFSYGNGKGHVGFVVGIDGDKLLLLGGNQSDKVSISKFGKSQLVSYRFPIGFNPKYF